MIKFIENLNKTPIEKQPFLQNIQLIRGFKDKYSDNCSKNYVLVIPEHKTLSMHKYQKKREEKGRLIFYDLEKHETVCIISNAELFVSHS